MLCEAVRTSPGAPRALLVAKNGAWKAASLQPPLTRVYRGRFLRLKAVNFHVDVFLIK